MAIYDFMIGPYVTCIKIEFCKIDDVFPDDLKQKVIRALEAEGLGPDGKPLVKAEPKEEKPVENKKEDKEIGAETSPAESKEEKASNDPKGDAKEPEGENKKESEEAKEAN